MLRIIRKIKEGIHLRRNSNIEDLQRSYQELMQDAADTSRPRWERKRDERIANKIAQRTLRILQQREK